ncbi:MAG: anaerobic ribonucleoside-triphosphate reductase [Candidatus Omnitrophica bacterium]|nr:anaerobic ribonucleoside-triphosphate reductase [Candidatus Omnitrophota bacterium]MBU1047250.1 anaerobic ribonucleoside-triphosphate reductase [Candidatus Omnitrophota bacterium]MBU1889165.1 anaerobic ribonucleoside-triphosphate reductase [Candidatus Omnitrophota bacterium]
MEKLIDKCQIKQFTIEKVRKRDGRVVSFDKSKIADAIFKAAESVGGEDRFLADQLAKVVEFYIGKKGVDVPEIEEIQDAVEKVLIETGHAKTAKTFILYRDWRTRVRNTMKVSKQAKSSNISSTDFALMVSTSQMADILPWDKKKISDALIKECDISPSIASTIASSVEEKIMRSELKNISTILIRELVDNELLVRGYSKHLKREKLLGMSMFNLENIVFSKSNENSNIAANNPEAVNLEIAENTLKQYSLEKLFSTEVSQAHLKGIIHIHDLGYPIRVYCSSHSIEYIKKYGLELNNLDTSSFPASHARTLTGHLNTFLASMQAYYAGALGVGYINILYAPYLVGMSDKQLKQEAQYLIFSCSQNAFSRGGQTLFLDFNLHTGVPSYLADVPAIGPGGKYTGKTYKDYEKETQRFCKALMDVWREGDCYGHVFAFPKMDLHINNDTFSDSAQHELFEYACQVASENGSPYFVFDRDEVTIAQCCRLRTKIDRTKVDDEYLIKHPESMRFCGFQNVTINLPQASYRAGKGNFEGVLKEIEKAIKLAMKAHIQKKKFISKLMSAPHMPLWQIGKTAKDDKPYVDLEKSTYIIGILGLNECVQHLTGKELHEDDETYKLGLKIIAWMNLKAKEMGKEHDLKVALEESPAESAARRLARIDLREFPVSKEVIKGDIENEEYYYTNSIHFRADAPISLVERIEKQSRFHPLIESGAILHAFIGEQKPSKESVMNLIDKTFHNTQAAQIAISPEFTMCNGCYRSVRGLKDSCSYCGSSNVYGITRIVGYFSRVNNWNKSKIGELKDRKKGNYRIG